MLLFVMKLLVWKKNFLKQKRKEGEQTSFCVHIHVFGDWGREWLLGGFFSSEVFVICIAAWLLDQMQTDLPAAFTIRSSPA